MHFREAALRAYDDARRLERHAPPPSRLGTIDHLYGIAAECALKAVLEGLGAFVPNPYPPKPFKVHIEQLWDEYATFVSGRAAAFVLPPVNAFSAWKADHRYEGDATFSAGRLAVHHEGAITAMLVLDQAISAGVVQ